MLDLVAILALISCAAGLGTASLVALRVPRQNPWEFGALSCAAGMGLIAVGLGVLGLLGVLSWTRWLLPLGAALSVGWWVRHRRGSSGAQWRRPSLTVLAAVLLLSPIFLGALAPVTDDDSLAYPIPIAAQLAADGEWRFWPHLARSVYPLSQQLLSAALIMLDSDRLGLLTAIQFVLTAALIAFLAVRILARPAAGLIAAIIALGCPAAIFLVGSTKEDLLLMSMTAAGAIALLSRSGSGAVALTGLFAGLAAGAKYSGLPIALGIVACVPFCCGRQRRASSLVLAVMVALAAGGLWYVVNLARFGNPIAPAFPSIGTFPSSPELVAGWLGGYGYGRAPIDFVLAPFRMALEIASWDAGQFGGRGNWINPIAWVGVPWTLIMWRRRQEFRPLLVIAFALYVTWFSSTQVARLLLPALVLLAVPAADAVLTAWTRFRLARAPIALVLAVSASLAIVVGAVRFTRYVADPGGYLAHETPHYDAIQWMNTHLDPAQDRVGSYLRAPTYLTIPWMNLSSYYQVAISQEDLDDPDRVLAALKRQGITHLVGRADHFEEPADWLVPVYANDASLEGGTGFFRSPSTTTVRVFKLK